MTIHATIRLFLLLTFLSQLGIGMVIAVYVPFLIRHGLTIFEMNLINCVYFGVQFVCEVPTGVIADRFGRKYSYVLACFLKGIGIGIYGFSTTVPMFMLSEAVDAVGATCVSGAFEAWITDQLRSLGFTGNMRTIFAREEFIMRVAQCIGAPLGMYLLLHDMSLPWIIAGGLLILTGVIAALFMKEDRSYATALPTEDHDATPESVIPVTMWGMVLWCLRHPHLRYVVVVSTVMYFSFAAPNMQWLVLCTQALGTDAWSGWIVIGIHLTTILGLLLMRRLVQQIVDAAHVLRILFVCAGLGIVLTPLMPTTLTMFLMFFIHEVFRGGIDPVRRSYCTLHIPSRQRATLGSVLSLTHHVGGGIGLLVCGAIGTWSIPVAWVLAGGLLIFAALRTKIAPT